MQNFTTAFPVSAYKKTAAEVSFSPAAVHFHTLILFNTFILLSLCLDQLQIVKVIDLHGFLHLIQCLCGDRTGLFAALFEDLVYSRDILFVLFTAGTDRLKLCLDDLVQELLDFDIAKTASGKIVRL